MDIKEEIKKVKETLNSGFKDVSLRFRLESTARSVSVKILDSRIHFVLLWYKTSCVHRRVVIRTPEREKGLIRLRVKDYREMMRPILSYIRTSKRFKGEEYLAPLLRGAKPWWLN